MSLITAKDLLAQADRLMRQRTPEELPVLTDLVIDDVGPMSLTARIDNAVPARARPARVYQPQQPLPASAPAVSFSPMLTPMPAAVLGPAPKMQPSAPPADMRDNVAPDGSASDPTREPGAANVSDPFNAQLLTQLETLQYDVYSQVMQQLEIYAAGSLKDHVRDMLLPVLTGIAQQIADETLTHVREVVSKAVDFEFARLREQLPKQKTTDGHN